MAFIENPVLRGFHGDPSILRVGDDYFMVGSSFEWFPGAPLYHSRDLAHWRLIDNILDSRRLLDLNGVQPSFGVWAPDLSYNARRRRFYLMYSNVHCRNKWFFDVDNYVIWTDDIFSGKWSDPMYINSSGFDPSLFHDDDGRTWVVNKDRDFRPHMIDRRSIILQELDLDRGELLGAPRSISSGATERRFVEGPHLYKHDGYYYLMTAEGGTGYGHCVALLRARSIEGPYEPSPYNPLITGCDEPFSGTEQTPFMMMDRYNPRADLQKAGHGSLVETQNGEWYVAHLCGRPVMPEQRCILGRETALQRVEWTEDGWLRMADGGCLAKLRVPGPSIPDAPFEPEPEQCDFDAGLPKYFYTQRNEITEDWLSLTRRPGFLSLRGRESLTSNYYPSLIARKLTAFRAQVTARLEFTPELYHHCAGITVFYDMFNHFTAYKGYDEALGGAMLGTSSFIDKQLHVSDQMVPVEADAPVWLRAVIDVRTVAFQYSLDGERFMPLGSPESILPLSDEQSPLGSFTGTFVGMFAQDSDRKRKWADFDFFRYEVLE